MAKNNKRNFVYALDSRTTWSYIGIDLAKYDSSIAATSDDGETFFIERIDNATMREMLSIIEPATISFEPCNGSNELASFLKDHGHDVMIVGGAAVQYWVKTYASGQKSDVGDAKALMHIAIDRNTHCGSKLKPIRPKTIEDLKLQAVATMRRQLVKQLSQSIVSFKGQCQNLNITLPKIGFKTEKIREILNSHREVWTDAVIDCFVSEVDRIEQLQKEQHKLDKVIDGLGQDSPTVRRLRTVYGVGAVLSAAIASTVGDIKRFPTPKSFMAYYGWIPRRDETGHNGHHGRMLKSGDKWVRASLNQAALSLYVSYKRKTLPDSGFKNWLDKRLDNGVKKLDPKSKVMLGSKILRIVWSLLTHEENFDWKKAGVPRVQYAQ